MIRPSGGWNGGYGDTRDVGKGELHVMADDLGVVDAGEGEVVKFALRPTWGDAAVARGSAEVEIFLGKWAVFLDEYGEAA